MNARRTWIVALSVISVVLGSIPAFAQDEFAYQEKAVKTVYPGDCDWVPCASVQLTPPRRGYVVVTASGFADFQRDDSMLQLTLSRNPGSKGRWIFNLTPGYQFFQTYSVRMVFPVDGETNYTFYLNGRSCNGTGHWIDVKTGSITAEFHPKGKTQPQEMQSPAGVPEKRDSTDIPREHRN